VSDLLTMVGFRAANDGTLYAGACRVELNPVGAAVVHKSAVKVTRESTSPAIDR
jgi:hypothetical protein